MPEKVPKGEGKRDNGEERKAIMMNARQCYSKNTTLFYEYHSLEYYFAFINLSNVDFYLSAILL